LPGDRRLDLLPGDRWLDLLLGDRWLDLLSGDRWLDLLPGDRRLDLLSGDRWLDLLSGDWRLDLLLGDWRLDLLSGDRWLDRLPGDRRLDRLSGDRWLDRLSGDRWLDRLPGDRRLDLLSGDRPGDLLLGDLCEGVRFTPLSGIVGNDDIPEPWGITIFTGGGKVNGGNDSGGISRGGSCGNSRELDSEFPVDELERIGKLVVKSFDGKLNVGKFGIDGGKIFEPVITVLLLFERGGNSGSPGLSLRISVEGLLELVDETLFICKFIFKHLYSSVNH